MIILYIILILSELAWKHTQNTAAEEIYLRTGYDATKPVTTLRW